LLEEGHDVNERGLNGASVLHMAAVSAYGTQTVDLLLSRGATLNQTDDFGYTPLHRFIGNGNIQGITMLLAQGANANLPAPGVSLFFCNDPCLCPMILSSMKRHYIWQPTRMHETLQISY
jgi:ankyrin repeat protein